MKNISLIKKFWVLGAVFSLVLVFEIISILSLNNESDSLMKAFPLQEEAQTIKLATVQVQQWLTDISATRGLDGLNDGFDQAEIYAKLFRKSISKLSILDPEQTKQYSLIQTAFDNYYNTGRVMAKAYIDEGPAGGNKMMADFDKAAETISSHVDSLLSKAKSTTAGNLDSQSALLANTRTTILIASVILGIIMSVIFIVLINSLKTVPIIGAELERIANGDLSGESLDYHRNDEIGMLVQEIENMKHQLRNALSEVASSTNEVFNAVNSVASIAMENKNGMDSQSTEVNQLATAINEMSATASDIARSASSASGAANEANNEADEGKSVAAETINKIKELSSDVSEACAVIGRVVESSDNIGSILDVIRGIADQTNLLALNAAIEAARAGEQGRGFAVVADEVRTLASRTQEATSEIQHMIEKLQITANDAKNAMEKGNDVAIKGVDQVVLTGQKLDSITNAVNSINDMNMQIASASEEQSAVSNEMDRSIISINDISVKTGESATKLSSASSIMFDQTKRLKEVVSKFKV